MTFCPSTVADTHTGARADSTTVSLSTDAVLADAPGAAVDVGPGAGCWDEVDDVDTVGEEADVAGVALEGARAWPAPEVGGGWTAAREPGPDVVREAAASVG